MDILVVNSEDSERTDRFVQHARERGHRVHRGTPGQRMLRSEEAWLGVVCFGPRFSSSDLQFLIEDLRYLSADLFVISSETKLTHQHDHVHWQTPDTADAQLLRELTAHCRAEPVSPAVRDQLVDPLVTAVRQTLVEMAGVDVSIRAVYQRTQPTMLGDLSAVLTLPTPSDGLLILSISSLAAETLARRILAEVKTKPNPDLVQDCVNEVGNIVAGQAKALLAGTPHHFTFSPPRMAMPNADRSRQEGTSVVIAFDTDIGNVALLFCR